jgi:hypothetical protein
VIPAETARGGGGPARHPLSLSRSFSDGRRWYLGWWLELAVDGGAHGGGSGVSGGAVSGRSGRHSGDGLLILLPFYGPTLPVGGGAGGMRRWWLAAPTAGFRLVSGHSR